MSKTAESEFSQALADEAVEAVKRKAKEEMDDKEMGAHMQDQIEWVQEAVVSLKGQETMVPPRMVVLFDTKADGKRRDAAVCLFDRIGEDRFEMMKEAGSTIYEETSASKRRVLAAIFLAEAKAKEMGADEEPDRVVREYEDATDNVAVIGATADRRMIAALLPLYRDDDGALEKVGKNVFDQRELEPVPAEQKDQLIDAFFDGYFGAMRAEMADLS